MQLPPVDDLRCQRRQGIARTDFEQEGILLLGNGRDGIGESHRCATMAGPVLRIGHLRRRRPVAGDT